MWTLYRYVFAECTNRTIINTISSNYYQSMEDDSFHFSVRWLDTLQDGKFWTVGLVHPYARWGHHSAWGLACSCCQIAIGEAITHFSQENPCHLPFPSLSSRPGMNGGRHHLLSRPSLNSFQASRSPLMATIIVFFSAHSEEPFSMTCKLAKPHKESIKEMVKFRT